MVDYEINFWGIDYVVCYEELAEQIEGSGRVIPAEIKIWLVYLAVDKDMTTDIESIMDRKVIRGMESQIEAELGEI